MKQFTETIRNHLAVFTLAEISDRGAVWEVRYLDQSHRFTLNEWVVVGETWCLWAFNQRAQIRHKARLGVPA